MEQVNQLNRMGLTPRGLVEAKDNLNGSPPMERLVRELLADGVRQANTLSRF